MLNLTNVFGMISATRPNYTEEENARRNEQLFNILKANGYQVSQCKGVYKGEKETSFLVELPSTAKHPWPLLDLLATLAATYHQESFIYCGGNSIALLFANNGEVLSMFTNIKPVTATCEYYTELDGETFTLA